MISVGRVARSLRESIGLSQKETAEKLGISNVHLCNVENGKAQPSSDLLAKYREIWGIDLYVFAWCESGDVAALPPELQSIARSLSDGWREHVERQLIRRQA